MLFRSIIAATNRDLAEQVRAGEFRADLYHRLSVYPVPVPPLRQRGDDVLLLAGYFLELNRTRLGFRSLRLSHQAEQALCAYAWPGNIRELEHVISRAALRAVSQGALRTNIVTLEPRHLDLDIVIAQEHSVLSANADEMSTIQENSSAMKEAVEQFQRQLIRRTLTSSNNNWAEVARKLELDASNLHKLAKRLGLK